MLVALGLFWTFLEGYVSDRLLAALVALAALLAALFDYYLNKNEYFPSEN